MECLDCIYEYSCDWNMETCVFKGRSEDGDEQGSSKGDS